MTENDEGRAGRSLEGIKKEMLEKLKSIGTPKVEKRAVGFQYYCPTVWECDLLD